MSASAGLGSNAELPRLIPIPAGEFPMGSDRFLPNERPRHRVVVASFRLAATAVTRRQYALFLASTGTAPPRFWEERAFQETEQPVCGVSWREARAYCEWLGEVTRSRIHLPTEAQREWAASGGDPNRLFPWGDLPRERGALSAPPLVAARDPNPFGLFDLGEGVHEWCADWYGADWYLCAPSVEPRGPPAGRRRSARGGSWRHQLPFSRVTARSALAPDKQFSDFGFRVAASEAFEYLP